MYSCELWWRVWQNYLRDRPQSCDLWTSKYFFFVTLQNGGANLCVENRLGKASIWQDVVSRDVPKDVTRLEATVIVSNVLSVLLNGGETWNSAITLIQMIPWLNSWYYWRPFIEERVVKLDCNYKLFVTKNTEPFGHLSSARIYAIYMQLNAPYIHRVLMNTLDANCNTDDST